MAWKSVEKSSRGFQAKVAVKAWESVFFRDAARGGCSGSRRWFHICTYTGAVNELSEGVWRGWGVGVGGGFDQNLICMY